MIVVVRCHRIAVLAVAIGVATAGVGCASDRHVRAVQQSAIGGGLVAAGATAATATVVLAGGSLAISAGSNDGPDFTAVAVGVGVVGGIITAITLWLGFTIMHQAEPDLIAPMSSPPTPPSPYDDE